MILGITGGTGCGKTTALQAIRELGGIIIDCDAVYHVLLQTDKKMLAAIEKRFPGTVVDGKLDRKKLGPIVFSDAPNTQRILSLKGYILLDIILWISSSWIPSSLLTSYWMHLGLYPTLLQQIEPSIRWSILVMMFLEAIQKKIDTK